MAVNGEQELDRSEPASPYRLEEARRRGQVARSTEVVGCAVLLAAALALQAWGAGAVQAFTELPRALWTPQGFALPASAADLPRLALRWLESALHMVAPGLACLMAVSLLASVLQTGPVWSSHPLSPDLSRLSPTQGLRRVFALRSLVDAARAVLKVAAVALVLATVLGQIQPRMGVLVQFTPQAAARTLVTELGRLSVLLAAVLAALAVIDLLWTRREYTQRMRMSRRELRDELRHREGDPRIRARLRALRREMLARLQSVQRTADADLVVVNPTHVAVALRYRHGEMSAPVVVSKGTGALAALIRRIAARHGIAVLHSPMLARGLHAHARVESAIPPEYYADVARLVVWVMARRGGPAKGAGA